MQIMKRNGGLVFYDTEKIAASILKANAGILVETISEKKATILAEEVLDLVAAENEFITTTDVHHAVYAMLKEKLYLKTAENYKAFAEAKNNK